MSDAAAAAASDETAANDDGANEIGTDEASWVVYDGPDVPHPAVIVQVAMDEEAQPFLELAESVSGSRRIGAALQRDLVIDGRPVLLIRSGIGFVNATAAATAAVLAHPRSPLISAGTAGGLAVGIRVGEVVVGDEYVNINADATAFGYEPGQVPGMPARYRADEALADAARADRATAASAESAGDGSTPLTVRSGVIGSGEKFVTADIAEAVRAQFPGLAAVDMESAALAQLAHTHGVRYVSVRGISDLCAPDGTEFLTHVDDAGARSAAVVRALLAAL